MTRTSTITISLFVLASALGCGPPRRQIVSAPVVMPTRPVEEPPPEEPAPVQMQGDTITIDQHILFAFDSSEILGDSNAILDHLAAFITSHADAVPTLEIIGHTDTQGTARHNQELSQGRAAAVAAALRERGVQITLTPIGRGHSEPVCTEATDECHVQNRRVVFHIVR